MKKIIAVMLCLALCFGLTAMTKEARAAGFVSVGDTVTMGTWGGEEITWRVMEVKEDGTCVLLSEYGLDAQPFHKEGKSVTWEKCTLRSWLNGEFYETAFTEAQKSKIVVTAVENPGNAYWGTEGGASTEDMVCLLSLEEVGRYFGVDPYADATAQSLICLPTETAVKNGATVFSEALMEIFQKDVDYPLRVGSCVWWLRSPGEMGSAAACVIYSGYVGIGGFEVNAKEVCVRPVICVQL